ncbi:MAG: protein kinase [Planctomycetota bacterium]
MIAKLNGNCDPNLVQQLIDGSLGGAEADRLQSHLDVCSECRRLVDELAGQDRWLSEARDTLRHRDAAETQWLPTPAGIASPSPALEPGGDHSESQSGSSAAIRKIGDHEVTRLIGRGGAGTVYLGMDHQLRRPIAVKVLHPHLCDCGSARRRFVREAQAAAALTHPNVVSIFAIQNDTDSHYLIMPFVDGGSLQQRVEREGPLPLDEVCRLGAQISDGLQAAHAIGLIHRDIKPANVLLDRSGHRAQITDFGIARALDDAAMTASGMVAGTPAYMSPEQAAGRPVDPRSDLFSLGSLLFTLATGRSPYRGNSSLAILRRVADQRPQAPSEVNEELPAWFDRLVAQFHQSDPQQRIGSAREASELLRAAAMHVRDPHSNSLPDSIRSQGRPSWPRWVAAIGLIIVVMTGVVIAGQSNRDSDSAMASYLDDESGTSPETREHDTPTGSSNRNQDAALTGSSQRFPPPPTGPAGPSDDWEEVTHELRELNRRLDQLLQADPFWPLP